MNKSSTSDKIPVQRLKTKLDWEDLALADDTQQQISTLETWLKHGATLLDDWGMRGKLQPGYMALFHGAPGTGKTLAASLLGKAAGRAVCRVNLSQLESKYIGETEKNLDRLFTKAQGKSWILFFDEADALFGKRTDVHSSSDRYANQEVSYLLQRLEQYEGLVIVSSNAKENIDEALSRRFQSIVHFPDAGRAQRVALWNRAFPQKARLEPGIDLESLAEQYELNRGAIMNVVQYCCLQALERGTDTISEQDLQVGIRNELRKSRLAPA